MDNSWEAFYCQDGVTGCVGFSGDNERAVMLSYVVRAPPRLVVKVGPTCSVEHCMTMRSLAGAPVEPLASA